MQQNIYVADRNEFEQEKTLLDPLLCLIPRFGQRVFRFPYGDDRMYFTENPAKIYSGLTGYINEIPIKKGSDAALVSYRMKHGERFQEELTHAADYGTFCHMAVAQFLTHKSMDLSSLKDEFRDYMIQTGMPMARFQKYWYRVVNDMKAFAQFAYEKELEPLATEYVVYDDFHGIATPLDIVARMKFNKKVRVVNINLKFRENPGVYDKDIIQTNIEMMIYNNVFGGSELECENTFIWSPSNWKTTPTYKLTNTTGQYTKEDWNTDHEIVTLLRKAGKARNPVSLDSVFTTKTGGKIELGEAVYTDNQTVREFIGADRQKA